MIKTALHMVSIFLNVDVIQLCSFSFDEYMVFLFVSLSSA